MAGADPCPSRRILFFTPAIPPDTYTAAARSGRLTRYLPEFGYAVDVVTRGRPADSAGNIYRAPREPWLRPAPLLSGVGQLLKRILPHDDQLPWAAQAYRTAARLARQFRYSAILSSAPPFGAHVAALLLARKLGIPCVCDFRDPLVGTPFREPEPYFPHDVPLERTICRHSAAIICNTDTATDQWRARYPHAADRIHTIWNGYDPDERLESTPAAAGGPLSVVHVGTLYGGRDPSPLLRSLARLKHSGRLQTDSALVHLAGPIEPECLELIQGTLAEVQALGLVNVDNRRVPPDEADRISDSARAHLVIDLNSQQTSLQVPAKLFRCIRLGRPILALTYADSPVERILARSGIPHCCIDPRRPAAEIDDAVLDFLSLPDGLHSPSPWFLQEFDGRLQARKLAGILDSLMA